MTLETKDRATIHLDPIHRPKFQGVNFGTVHHLNDTALERGDRVTIYTGPAQGGRRAVVVNILEGPKGYVWYEVHFNDDTPDTTYSFLARDSYTWWKLYLECVAEARVPPLDLGEENG